MFTSFTIKRRDETRLIVSANHRDYVGDDNPKSMTTLRCDFARLRRRDHSGRVA